MSKLDKLIEGLLLEATLTKGSQRVMANKDLVGGIADALRDDARAHPQNFPAGSSKTFQKAPDEELAQWFLEKLDEIEREGYEGTVYSRDGVNSDWIARRYVAGSHNMEDLIGVLNMNLRDWYLLKNRDMLDPNHRDLPKFNSARDVGKYMTTHYNDKLTQVRDAAKIAALNKSAKKAKLVDNEDYTIYTVFNWAAARAIGLGTQWCTANSTSDSNYDYYSNNGMLFQLFPKNPEQVDKAGKVLGKKVSGPEKYQFDGGSGSFMDISDDKEPAKNIKEKFPYLFSDLVKALKANKEKLEAAMAEMAADPKLSADKASKTKVYDVDDEIEKLKKKLGDYWTNKVRPEPEPEQPQIAPPEEPVKEDDAPGVGDDMPTGGAIGAMGGDTPPAAAGTYPPGTAPTMPESFKNKGRIMENVDKDVAAMIASLKKYDKLVESVAPVLGMRTLGEKKDGKKPEWLEDAEKKAEGKEGKKEEVDEGKTNRKECPVCHEMPCVCDDDTVMEKDEGKHNNGKTTGFKAVAKNAAKEYGSKEAGEKVAGAVHAKMKAAGKLEEDTGPDQEVLNWMKRFSKLGNMKGYGR